MRVLRGRAGSARRGRADAVDQSLITAGLRRLQGLRGELYRCLGRRGDALFELVDALLAAEAMPSLPREQTVRTTGRVADSLLRWWAAYHRAWEYGACGPMAKMYSSRLAPPRR
jgi:hypothetical protein